MGRQRNQPEEISEQKLEYLVGTSRSFRQIFAKLGLATGSFAAEQLRSRIKANHNISHFLLVPGVKRHPHFQAEWLDRFTKEEFAALIRASTTHEEFCRAAGLPEGHARTLTIITEHAEKLGVDLSHFTYVLRKKGHRAGRALSLKALLVENSDGYAGGLGMLAKSLIRNKILPNECGRCHLGPIWRGKPLTMKLVCKNHNKRDLRQENLLLVCPNCEEQLMRVQRSERMRKAHDTRRAKRQAKLNGQAHPKPRP